MSSRWAQPKDPFLLNAFSPSQRSKIPSSLDPTWDWEYFLDSLGRFGVQLGLERMEQLLDRLGHPQQGIPVIHVAGTNGKGSVCALLSHVLHAAGYRVGRYISPHLISWRERIWVDGAWIPLQTWQQILWELSQVLQTYPPDQDPPTQFEVATAAAWIYFRQQQVDWVVLEVGLGGRLDATNVGIDPKVSIITSIGWDHWQRLGHSLELIAGEKAGICKPGVPVITAPQVESVLRVLETKAAAKASPLQIVTPAEWVDPQQIRWRDQVYPLPLRGDVQLINSALALTAIERLQQQGWPIPFTAVQTGFSHTHWPGRLQIIHLQGQPILLDGAHNGPSAQALRQFIDQHLQGSVTWLIGILSTKDVEGILQVLLRPGDSVITLPVASHMACDPDDLATLAQQIQPQLEHCQSCHNLQDLQVWLAQRSNTSNSVASDSVASAEGDRDPTLRDLKPAQDLQPPQDPDPLVPLPTQASLLDPGQGSTPLQREPIPQLVLCGSLYLIGQVMQECLGWDLAQGDPVKG